MSLVVDRALRLTHVGIADGAAHVIQRYALIKQRLRVKPHAHGGQRTAADIHIADAVNLRDCLRQLR